MPRVHEQISTWGVPLRWFVFVDLAEKQLSISPGRRVLRYRTEISKARRRAHRAHSVLRKALGDAPITEAVEESTRWLEEFHPRSLVELDVVAFRITEERAAHEPTRRFAVHRGVGAGTVTAAA